jgi:hypothetical protein
MRKKDMKFHIAAVSILSAIIIVMFFAMGKPAPQGAPAEVIGDRYIQIDSASWGRECNKYVNEAISKWYKADQKTRGPKPQAGANNNALTNVSAECNGKLSCDLQVNSETLGAETVATCLKSLRVGYRCFDYDRLTLITARQGELLKINCREAAAK